jgi:hypothetical protein
MTVMEIRENHYIMEHATCRLPIWENLVLNTHLIISHISQKPHIGLVTFLGYRVGWVRNIKSSDNSGGNMWMDEHGMHVNRHACLG